MSLRSATTFLLLNAQLVGIHSQLSMICTLVWV
nr:MAG TPA: hypothetical protein [Caudoviricetes sp.]